MKFNRKWLAGFAGLVATMAMAADLATIQPQAVQDRIAKKDASIVVLDVRTPEEFAQGHVPGAINVPHDQITNRIGELLQAKNKTVVLYCRSGRRSGMAADTLKEKGFINLLQLEGNMQGWADAKLPVEK